MKEVNISREAAVNGSSKAVDEIKGKVADSFFLRLRGLIGRDPKSFGPLLITPCSDIHTFFMSDAIDVVYLDKGNKVLKVARNLMPGKVFAPVKHARSVLEIPAGYADKWNIQEHEVWKVNIHGRS